MKKTLCILLVLLITAVLVIFPIAANESESLVTKGYIDQLICEAGSEMIIRMGNASIIATQKGGVSDVTAGVDLPDGNVAPSNHLLIVPVADGRGLFAHDQMLVMIKGGYSVK